MLKLIISSRLLQILSFRNPGKENIMALWVVFAIIVLGMLALDLGFFHRKGHVVSVKEALVWSAVWVVLSLLFSVGVYFRQGPDRAIEFLAGYIIEKALSIDNIFVFLMIFSYFKVDARYQHKVLFWGILGALVTRALFIALGVALIERLEWMLTLFGALLIVAGIRMFFRHGQEVHPERNPVLRLFQRIMPVTKNYVEGKFFIKEGGSVCATPLFIVVLMVESTDVIFAVDSIPAIFGITLDPFIVYSSNVFAILGLRALYFALAGTARKFYYLRHGLSTILIFIGVKMILADYYKMPTSLTLATVALILAISIAFSLVHRNSK